MQHPDAEPRPRRPDPDRPLLSSDDQRSLLRVAVTAIAAAAEHPVRPMPEIDPLQFSSLLQKPRASFVTLHCRGRLRGCRGSVTAQEPLIVNVARSARAAAFFDERFSPVSHAEVRDLDLHVSILATPRPLPVTCETDLLASLRRGRDGLIMRVESRQSLFLPAMWNKLPGPREFVEHLKVKAGLPASYWSSSMEWHRFTVEEFAGCSADLLHGD